MSTTPTSAAPPRVVRSCVLFIVMRSDRVAPDWGNSRTIPSLAGKATAVTVPLRLHRPPCHALSAAASVSTVSAAFVKRLPCEVTRQRLLTDYSIGLGGSPSYFTGMRMRIGFSRAYSSATSAVRPATRPTMKIEFSGRRIEAEIVENRREGAINIERQLLDSLRRRALERGDEGHAVTGDAVLPCEIEQNLHARIGSVNAVAEAREPCAVAHRPLDRAHRGVGDRDALAARLFGALLDRTCTPGQPRRGRCRSPGRPRQSPPPATRGCPMPPAGRPRRKARRPRDRRRRQAPRRAVAAPRRLAAGRGAAGTPCQ